MRPCRSAQTPAARRCQLRQPQPPPSTPPGPARGASPAPCAARWGRQAVALRSVTPGKPGPVLMGSGRSQDAARAPSGGGMHAVHDCACAWRPELTLPYPMTAAAARRAPCRPCRPCGSRPRPRKSFSQLLGWALAPTLWQGRRGRARLAGLVVHAVPALAQEVLLLDLREHAAADAHHPQELVDVVAGVAAAGAAAPCQTGARRGAA